MSERIDHVAKAIKAGDLATDAWNAGRGEYATALLASAQAHATLALVEQQRIANLIAYVAKWTDDEVLDVDAEIRELLGIEERHD